MRNSMTAWLIHAALVNGPTLTVAQTHPVIKATAHGLSIAAVRPETTVVLTRSEDTVFVDIRCPRGIDRGQIQRLADNWPSEIRIRFYLGGLESFKAGNGSINIRWSVSNSANRRTTVSLQTGSDRTTLTPDSPYWTAVAVSSDKGEGARASRYFEVVLPQKLFDDNPRDIKLHWIDVFRR